MVIKTPPFVIANSNVSGTSWISSTSSGLQQMLNITGYQAISNLSCWWLDRTKTVLHSMFLLLLVEMTTLVHLLCLTLETIGIESTFAWW
jgi:hypothetical protein